MDAKSIVLAADEGEFIQTQVARLIKARGSDTAGAMSFTVVSSQPGFAGPPLHRHLRNAEVFYVLEGSFRFRIGEDYRDVTRGGFVFVPIGTPHGFASVGGEGRMIVIFSPADFEGYFDEIARINEQHGTREEIAAAQMKFGMEVLGPPIGAADA